MGNYVTITIVDEGYNFGTRPYFLRPIRISNLFIYFLLSATAFIAL